MKIAFHKYHGAGNDFILVDNRRKAFPKADKPLVTQLCQRRFGIGSDGVILLEPHPDVDFEMVYLNPDGSLAPMCGNGARCLMAFARDLGLIDSHAVFMAADGLHRAAIQEDFAELQLRDVPEVAQRGEACFVDTGAPHHVVFCGAVAAVDVHSEGKRIRREDYGRAGANVNFAQCHADGSLSVRTYERGVERETWSCGTGAAAAALAAFEKAYISKPTLKIKTRGADLQLSFTQTPRGYEDITLAGPVRFVFKGVWEVSPLSKGKDASVVSHLTGLKT